MVITTPFGLTDGILELGSMVTKSKISLISILFFFWLLLLLQIRFLVWADLLRHHGCEANSPTLLAK